MKISNLKLTPAQIAGNTEATGILISVTPGYEYQNGKRTET